MFQTDKGLPMPDPDAASAADPAVTLTRRTLLATVWSTPVIVAMTATPAMAASLPTVELPEGAVEVPGGGTDGLPNYIVAAAGVTVNSEPWTSGDGVYTQNLFITGAAPGSTVLLVYALPTAAAPLNVSRPDTWVWSQVGGFDQTNWGTAEFRGSQTSGIVVIPVLIVAAWTGTYFTEFSVDTQP